MSKSELTKSNWQGKTRGGKFGYWFFVQLLNTLGLPFAYFFLRFIVIYFAIFAPTASKHQFHFLRKTQGFSILKAIVGVVRNYFLFGQVILDKVAIMSGVKTKFTYNFDGEEYLHQMAKDQKGGLLVGAHVGNWEIAGQLLQRINTKVHILMLDEEHQKIKELLLKSMSERQLNIIAIKSDMSHLIKIKEAFSRNEFVAMHGDRFLGSSKHLYSNFFGRKAAFPSGPFYMAMKFSVPITFVSAVKESKNHYHFFSTEPKLYANCGNPKLRDEQIQIIIDLYTQNLESLLKKYPLQWFNYYDFWA